MNNIGKAIFKRPIGSLVFKKGLAIKKVKALLRRKGVNFSEDFSEDKEYEPTLILASGERHRGLEKITKYLESLPL